MRLLYTNVDHILIYNLRFVTALIMTSHITFSSYPNIRDAPQNSFLYIDLAKIPTPKSPTSFCFFSSFFLPERLMIFSNKTLYTAGAYLVSRHFARVHHPRASVPSDAPEGSLLGHPALSLVSGHRSSTTGRFCFVHQVFNEPLEVPVGEEGKFLQGSPSVRAPPPEGGDETLERLNSSAREWYSVLCPQVCKRPGAC